MRKLTSGQIWEKDGLQREIINISCRGFGKNNYDVTWRRPGTKKEYTLWLPYWERWCKKAHRLGE